MALLPIVTLPDPRLRKISVPVSQVDAELHRLLDDMLETMYAAPGIGLAAIQVAVPKRIVVIDIAKTEEERAPLFLINPEILWASEELSSYQEGCLSVPDYYEDVKRPARVRVRHLDRNGQAQEFDAEGRYVEARFKQLSVISVYMPSGSSSPERQEAKYRYLDSFLPHLIQLKKSGREIVLRGDVNIAHHEIDLKNWKGNVKNSGFLPEERAWLTNLFGKVGYVDVYRKIEPEAGEACYTWWSNRGQAYAKNVGWRIDYQIATPGIANSAQNTSVYKTERFSDHAPLVVDYDWSI